MYNFLHYALKDVERVFGLMKKRWPRLRIIDCASLAFLNYIIQGCVVLHNLTVFQDDNIEEFMATENEDPVRHSFIF